ncbi:hypothetical protein Tco_0600718 [Tanacetum coccineum]
MDVEYVMSKILGFYKECLELGPEYVTGMDDEGEVTKFLIKNEEEIFTDAGDGVRIYPDGVASPAIYFDREEALGWLLEEITVTLTYLEEKETRSLKTGLSTPTPVAFKPLCTYKTVSEMAEASGDAKKAAAFLTSFV